MRAENDPQSIVPGWCCVKLSLFMRLKNRKYKSHKMYIQGGTKVG